MNIFSLKAPMLLIGFLLLNLNVFGQDTTPPVASCHNATVFVDATGTTTISPSDIDYGSTDNVGIDYLLINNSPFHNVTCADIGTQLATLTVVDFAGNQSICSAMVSVIDSIPPTNICYDDTVYLNTNGSLTVTGADFTHIGVDNCAVTSTLINGQANYTFTTADIGTQIVSFETVDASGNMSSCQANITVIQGSTVSGKIYNDYNSNCVKDLTEVGAQQNIVTIQGNNYLKQISTDADGYYSIALDTGSYTISIVSNNPYWQVCNPVQTFQISSANTTHQVDFGMQALISCPALYTSVAAPFLRMTGGGSNYTVHYSNYGTIPAYNAYIEVDLDPNLNVLGTSLPIASQNGNTYTFMLDTIDVLEYGSFTIHVLVDASAALGQTHCTEAHIYPDSACGITWAGPDFSLNSNCTTDSAFFDLTNIGGAMTSFLDYYIYEDDVIIYQDSFQLTTGALLNVSIPVAQGKTYRFSTDTIPGYPSQLGDGFVTKALEDCNLLPGHIFLTSYVTSQYNGNSAPAIALDCQQNIFAYDPNDKAAQPEGYGAEHYIEKNTALDYRIRFQNTGNDTAFTVVLKDTLSTHLDLTTLQMGASSHPYTWTLNGQELTIRFDNIMLPDSNVNEPASNGFVKYTIDQLTNLPLETRIENTAHIYFDFNPAIVTNTTFHTIGENFYSIQLINVSVTEHALETTEYQIFPNPTQNLITVQQSTYGRFNLQLFNLNGQLLQTYNDLDGQHQFNLAEYPVGTYILKVQDEKQVSTYKVVKH